MFNINRLKYILLMMGFMISTSYSQVTEVKFLIKYSMDSCNYEACMYVETGNTVITTDRYMGASSFNIVVPFGNNVNWEYDLMPLKNNQNYGSTIPWHWALGATADCPMEGISIFHFSAIAGGWFNDLMQGDTVCLFGFSVDGPDVGCGLQVRPFINGQDPNSSMPCTAGQDYSNGMPVGSVAQDYIGNLETQGPPAPDITYEVSCGADLIIDITTTDSMMCKTPNTYIWTYPDFSMHNIEDVNIVNPGPSDWGDYELYIEDAFGCDTTITITVDPPPSIDDQTISICEPGSVTLEAFSPLDGTWVLVGANTTGVSLGGTANGLATAGFDATASGDYEFEYQASSGCPAKKIISVGGGVATPILSGGDVCVGGTIMLSASAISGPGVSYEWRNSANFLFSTATNVTIPNAVLADAGTYTFTVTDADGCSASEQITIDVFSLPNVMIDYEPSYCAGQDVTLEEIGGDGTTWSWSGPNSISGSSYQLDIMGISSADAGTYTVTVTNGNMCTAEMSVDIVVNNPPSAILPADFSVCLGEDIIINETSADNIVSWDWTFNGNPVGGNSSNLTISNAGFSDGGTYAVMVTDNNGCTAIESMTVSINVPPAPTVTGDLSYCQNEDIYLEETGGQAISWSWEGPNGFTSTSKDISISGALVSHSGTYTVTITDNNNCTGSTSVDVQVHPLPTPIPGYNTGLCQGEILLLTETGATGTSWSWSGPNSFSSTDQNPSIPNITSSGAGDYTVTVTDANGCSNSQTITVSINALPNINISGTSPVCTGDEIQFDETGGDAVSWVWSGPGIEGNTTKNPVISAADVTHNTTFTVQITDANGCTNSASVDIEVNPKPDISISPVSDICAGEDINLGVTGGTSWSWSGPNSFTSTEQNPVVMGATIDAGGNYSVTITDANGCTNTASVSLAVHPLPTATASSNGPVCQGEDLTLMETGGDGVMWMWVCDGGFTSTEQNPVIAGMTSSDAGTCTVTVTDANGCTSSDVVNIEVKNLPIANVSSNGPICEGNKLELKESGADATSWSWSFNGGSPFSTDQNPTIDPVNISNAGTYTVTITDANGCTATGSVDVTVNASPNVSIDQIDPICEGDLIAFNESGGNAVSWVWDGPGLTGNTEQSPVIPISDATHNATYTVTITDAFGCQNSASVDVTVHPLPTATASSNGPVCQGEDLTLMETGGDGVMWMWVCDGGFTSTEQNPVIAGMTSSDAGTCTVTVTDVNGCTNTSTVDISTYDLPSAIATGNGPVCEGNKIELYETGGQGVSWSWSFNGGSPFSTNQNPVIDPAGISDGGIYTVTITDANGCTATGSVDVTVNVSPNVSIDQIDPICEGDLIAFNESGGNAVSWVWDGPGLTGNTEQSPVIPISDATHNATYTVTITDAFGCQNTASVDVTVHPLPTATASSNGPVCQGEDLTLMETGGDGVMWMWVCDGGFTSSEQNPVIAGMTSSDAGTCTVTVTDVNGCTNTATVDISAYDIPNTAVSSNGPVCEGNKIELYETGGQGVSWSWSFNGGSPFSSNQNPVIDPAGISDGGIYTVTITDANGCTATGSVDVTVNALPSVNIPAIAPVCAGETITFDENGGQATSWSWSGPGIDGSTDQNPVISTADATHNATYTVTITDAFGCQNTASVDVTVHPLPTATASSNGPVCQGEDLTLMETGGDGVMWMWVCDGGFTSTEQNPVIAGMTSSDAGTCTVTVTDVNGCTNTSTVDISAYDIPNTAVSSNGPVCEGNKIELYETGGQGVSWSWSFNGGSPFSTNQTPVIDPAGISDGGIYTVTITDANGCTATGSVDVTVNALPSVNIPTIAPVCEGETIVFDENGGQATSWSWSGPGIDGSTDQNPVISTADATHNATYMVTITDAFGCQNTASVDVTVHPLPTATASSNGPVCQGEDLTLMETGGDGVMWMWVCDGGFTSTEQNPVIAGMTSSDAGTCTVTVTDVNGCTNTATVDISAYDIPNTAVSSNGPVCEGNKIELYETGGQGVSWSWSFNGGSPFSTNQSPVIDPVGISDGGIYTVTITDANGCTATGSVDVTVNALPQVEAGTYPDICTTAGAITLVGTPSSGVFSGDGVLSGIFDPVIAGPGTHDITYEYTDVNGCSSMDMTTITVYQTPTLTIDMIGCSADLLSYDISVTTSGVLSATAGTISGNTIMGIPAGMDVTITAVDASGNCEVMIPVTAPNCDCDEITPPILGSGGQICAGENIPELSVSVDAGLEARWYTTPTGGSPIHTGSTFTPSIASDPGVYTYYVDAHNPIDDCTSNIRTEVILEILDVPQITNTDTEMTICQGGMTTGFEIQSDLPGATFSWTATSSDVTGFTTSGVGNIPAEVLNLIGSSQGKVIYSVVPQLNGCSGTEVDFSVTVNPNPVLEVVSVDCSSDLLSYSITLNFDGNLDAGGYTISGNQVIGIPGGTNITLSATNPTTGCTSSIDVNAPVCDCDEVATPVSGGDQEVCLGDDVPSLSVTAPAGTHIDWYNAMTGGSPLGTGLTYSPIDNTPGTYTYYAEAVNDLDGCVSERIPVSLTIHILPSIDNITTDCADDLLSYSVFYSTSANVTSTSGVVGVNQISGIMAGTDITITLSDPVTGCEAQINVSAPDCNCNFVEPPVNSGDRQICEGDDIPMLLVSTVAGTHIDWYDAPTGGNPLGTGLSYLPVDTLPGSYTYYAEAVNDTDGCTSDRVPVMLVINSGPAIDLLSKECSDNMDTYSVEFSTTGNVLVSAGILTGNTVTDIDTSMDLTITVTDTGTGCTSQLFVSAPTCSCDFVQPPMEVENKDICLGDQIPSLSVIPAGGTHVVWYDVETGGTSIATGMDYTPSVADAGTYIYYAESVNDLDGCVSDRTPVTLTIHDLPSIQTGDDQEICEGEDIPELTVFVSGNLIANWYVDEISDSPVLTNSSMYQPPVSDPGTYDYFVELTDPVTGCISNREPIILKINPLPELKNVVKNCSDDLTMWSVSFETMASVTYSGPGSVSGNTIDGIPTGTDITIDLKDENTGCINQVSISAPSCDCSDVPSPISSGNVEICAGEDIPSLEVTVMSGMEVRWYDVMTGGTSLGVGTSFVPSIPSVPGIYDFYVESIDLTTDCISDRIPVTLTILDFPVITNMDLSQEICSGESFEEIILTADKDGTTFSWTTVSEGVSGNTDSGTGNISPEVLTSIQGGVVRYIVVPQYNGCEGAPVEFVINVKGLPDAGEDQSLDCIDDAITHLNAVGDGVWSTGSNPGSVVIADVNDASTEVRNFSQPGVYEFVWTVDGCSASVFVTVGNDCPCAINGNNIIQPIDDVFCMTTGQLVVQGEEGSPSGGEYQWLISKNGTDYIAPSEAKDRDFNAFDLTGGSYILRRLYSLTMDNSTCVDTSNEVKFFVFDDKLSPGDISFEPSPLCQGDTMMLFVDYNPALDYNWTVSSGGRVLLTVDSMSMVVVENSGTLTIQVTQSLEGCNDGLQSAASSLDVEVNPIPHPYLGPDTTFCELDEPFTLNPGDFDEYQWQDGSDDNEFVVYQKGVYSVTVVDSMGCVGFDEVHVKSFCCDFAYPDIINIDSQNGNDKFHITDIYGCMIESEIKIFDRWGNLVYIGPGVSDWDGTFKGKPVEQGVYVFIVNYTGIDADGNEFDDRLHGDITVLRNR